MERLSVQRACGLDTKVELILEFKKIIRSLDFFVSFHQWKRKQNKPYVIYVSIVGKNYFKPKDTIKTYNLKPTYF
jgi:hypothetical protein